METHYNESQAGDTENSSIYQKFTIASYTLIVEHSLGQMTLFTISEIHCKRFLCNEFPCTWTTCHKSTSTYKYVQFRQGFRIWRAALYMHYTAMEFGYNYSEPCFRPHLHVSGYPCKRVLLKMFTQTIYTKMPKTYK